MYTLTNLFEALPISSTTDVSLSNLSDYPRKCSLKSFLSLFNIIIKKTKTVGALTVFPGSRTFFCSCLNSHLADKLQAHMS